MAIKIFIISIILIGLGLTQLKVDVEIESKKNQKTPLVTFYDSIMYELDEQNVKRTLQSKQILHFDTRDEIYDGTIVVRTKNGLADSISAEYIQKQENEYKFYQSVFAITNNGERLTSDRLFYNDLTKIITNDTEFILSKDDNILVGNNLYFDTIKEYFKADNTHFILKDLKQ
jgi:hypothetical protein